jgi:Secretion system C-terminal sorting domain
MSGCHNGAPGCIRVFRTGDRDRKTDFIAKQIDTLTKICGAITSLEKAEFVKKDILLHPNPFTGIFYVENANAETYRVFDIQGKLLASGTIQSNSQALPLSELPEGVYLLVVGLRYFKIVKGP